MKPPPPESPSLGRKNTPHPICPGGQATRRQRKSILCLPDLISSGLTTPGRAGNRPAPVFKSRGPWPHELHCNPARPFRKIWRINRLRISDAMSQRQGLTVPAHEFSSYCQCRKTGRRACSTRKVLPRTLQG